LSNKTHKKTCLKLEQKFKNVDKALEYLKEVGYIQHLKTVGSSISSTMTDAGDHGVVELMKVIFKTIPKNMI